MCGVRELTQVERTTADHESPIVVHFEGAEGERFELSVEVDPLRRFSKPLVSAAHPPLQCQNHGREECTVKSEKVTLRSSKTLA